MSRQSQPPTPTPTLLPGTPLPIVTATPTLQGVQYSDLGVYYSQITPAPPAPKPWETVYLPLIAKHN
jgi:hypothetical protein